MQCMLALLGNGIDDVVIKAMHHYKGNVRYNFNGIVKAMCQ